MALAPTNTAPTGQMSMEQQDQLATQLILSQQKLRKKSLGTFTLRPGETTSIKMANVGLLVGLEYIVRAVGTAATTGAMTNQGNMAAFNLLNRVQFVDIDSTTRHNATPFEIWLANSININKLQGVNHYAPLNADADVPVAGTSIAPNITSTVADAFSASFYQTLPLCLHTQGDLRGAVNLQSVLGDAYLQVTANSLSGIFSVASVVNDETVWLTDAASISALAPVFTTFEIEVIQQFYTIESYPLQGGNFIALPPISSRTVYAIEGAVKTSDNMSANGEKQISFPNNRNIRNAIFTYFNNGLLGGSHSYVIPYDTMPATNVQRIKFLTGAGDYVEDSSSQLWLASQQDQYNLDLGAGVYLMDFRRSPASSSVFGTMQAVFILGSTVTNAKFGVCYESHYLKGAALSNVTQ